MDGESSLAHLMVAVGEGAVQTPLLRGGHALAPLSVGGASRFTTR